MRKEECKMIYSEDINKVCALCRHGQRTENNGDELFCELKKRSVPVAGGDCGKFEYDIFKKTVRRRKRLKTNFSSEDFSLE